MRPVLILIVAIACASCKSTPAAPTGVTVTSISPTSGSTLGGTLLTIVGQNFAGSATVTVGGEPATDVQVTSPRTITAMTAQHARGSADVMVSLAGRTGTLPGAFTYVSPGATTNAAPVVVSLTARGTRPNQPAQYADYSEVLDLTAVVQDAETPVANLTYEYTTDAGGAITGSGPAVKWRAPAQAGFVPITAIVGVTVTEKYNSVDDNGLPVTRENKASRTATISVHNSVREVAEMAQDFLIAFSRQRPPTEVVRDFRDACPRAVGGKQAELNDVVANQRDFLITDFGVDPARVGVAFGGQCTLFSTRNRPGDACANVGTEWWSTLKRDTEEGKAGTKFHVKGVDQVSAAFIDGRWWLCESDFLGNGINAATGAKMSTLTFKK